MSYPLTVLSDLPLAYWRLNETTGTTAANLTGLGFTGTYTNGPSLGLNGLTAGGGSVLFAGTQRVNVNLPNVFVNGREADSFAFEVWVKPSGTPTVIRPVMGRADQSIRLTPDGVEFNALSTDGNRYIAYYTVTDWTETLHITANYVGRNLSLIVNGQEGTNADFFGNFDNTSDLLYLGGYTTANTEDFIASDFAVYNRPLNIRTATKHYDTGRLSASVSDAIQNAGGAYYAFDDSTADVSLSYTETTDEDFQAGKTDDIIISGNALIGEVSGVHTSDIQYIGGVIAGSRIDWDASESVVIDSSLDLGNTWQSCTNHAEIPGLVPGFDATNTFLKIRKTFSRTETQVRPPRLDRLSFVIYNSKTSNSDSAFTAASVYGSPTLAQEATPYLYGSDNMGLRLTAGSYVTIPDQPFPVNAIEFWMKRDSTTRNVISASGVDVSFGPFAVSGFSEINVNGAPSGGESSFPLNNWVHVVGNLTAPLEGPVVLNLNGLGAIQIAHVGLYATPLSTQQRLLRYNTSLGSPTVSVVDLAAGSIVEVPEGLKAYSNVWNTTQTGVV